MADRRSALEAAIDADPYDLSNFEVLGDVLAQQGDPRGELIAQQLKAEREPGYTVAEELIQPFAPKCSRRTELHWRAGYVYRADVAFDEVAQVIDHPSSRFLVKLGIRDAGESRLPVMPPFAPVLAHLVARRHPALRALMLLVGGIGHCALGDLAPLWEAVPELEMLGIGGTASSTSPIRLPHLQRLWIGSSRISVDLLARIREADWPALQQVTLHGGISPDARREIRGLFESPAIPQLDELDIDVSGGLEPLILLLVHSPLIHRLRVLRLSRVNEFVAELVIDNAAAFQHLERLDLRGAITEPMRARVLACGPNIRSGAA